MDAQLVRFGRPKSCSGNAVYIERFHCEENDYETLERLANDLDRNAKEEEEEGMINWSKHLKQENPEFSETFRTIVERMAEYFDVDVFATRLNFYRDGSDWKPYHHDSHAFGANGHKEDFTMGASFGAPRALSFLHEPSASSFEFPQKNGDVFAFSSEVNAAMKHGVPQLSGQEQFENNPRFSVIAWGRRRSLNARNSSVSSSSEKTTIAVDGSRMPWHHNTRNDEEGKEEEEATESQRRRALLRTRTKESCPTTKSRNWCKNLSNANETRRGKPAKR